MSEEQERVALELSELKRQIDSMQQLDNRGLSASSWVSEYNKKLLRLKECLTEPLKASILQKFQPFPIPPSNIADIHTFQEGNTAATRLSGEIYRLLLQVDAEFFKTEKKKREAELQRAEAERRKAVADYKEQGKRIEETDAARVKNLEKQ